MKIKPELTIGALCRVAGMLLGILTCGLAAQSPAGRDDAFVQVQTLADDVWRYGVGHSTLLRLQQGLPIQEFEDWTLVAHHEKRAQIDGFRERLEAIDSLQLSGDELTTYRILAFELRHTGANDDDYWLKFDVTPNQAPYYFQISLQALGTRSVADKRGADHFLMLVGELADFIDQLAAKVHGQVERGIYLPKPALPSTRTTWVGMRDETLATVRVPPEKLAALREDDRQAFNAALEILVAGRIQGGFARLFESLDEHYESKAPQSVGLSQYPGGAAVYQRAIESSTTLDLQPAAIHEIGKAAVQDIAGRMAAIRKQLGFDGSASEFLDQIKKNPEFVARSPAEVEARYREYTQRIEPLLAAYFSSIPKAPHGVRRLPLAAEPGITYGYYSAPTPDEPFGLYQYNGSNLEKRSLIWSGSLIYHELLPGHHFHLATQHENESLQMFRKHYSADAFTEGWAEYAASLGIEMGMYRDPYELYGRYLAEMFFAVRLVVDTGMNALGWELEEARNYMASHVVQSDEEIDSELLRYSTSIPAQALAYRLGYEKLRELRKLAEESFGQDFDIREFHKVILSSGARPLPVLESNVREWVAASLKQ